MRKAKQSGCGHGNAVLFQLWGPDVRMLATGPLGVGRGCVRALVQRGGRLAVKAQHLHAVRREEGMPDVHHSHAATGTWERRQAEVMRTGATTGREYSEEGKATQSFFSNCSGTEGRRGCPARKPRKGYVITAEAAGGDSLRCLVQRNAFLRVADEKLGHKVPAHRIATRKNLSARRVATNGRHGQLPASSGGRFPQCSSTCQAARVPRDRQGPMQACEEIMG